MYISCTLRVMNKNGKYKWLSLNLGSLWHLFLSIMSVIFCKKGNYFWGLCFRRVVIFEGISISGFANTWDILSLVLEVGLPELESATFEGSLLSQLYGSDKFVEDFRRLTTTSPRTSADCAGWCWYPVPIFCWFRCRFRWAFKVRSDGGVENDAVYITLPFVHCKAFS